MADRIVFAWWPVPLYECESRMWRATGRSAWLERVRRVETVWGDVFHVSLRKPE
jgi:hypothetical protein